MVTSEPSQLSVEGGDEAEPLLGERRTAILEHKESIHSFVVFMPPLTRRTHGHYCTLPVLLALVLFTVTTVTQLSLTLIAGTFIQEKSRTFKVSLIRHEKFTTTAMTPVDSAREYVEWGWTKMTRGWAERPPGPCCDSAECTEMWKCCSPGHKQASSGQHHVRNATSFLGLLEIPSADASTGDTAGTTTHSPKEDPKAIQKLKKMKELLKSFVYGSRGEVVLCRKGADGFLDCSPPSFAFLDAWHELDDNGDGVWTIAEAEADRTNLGCRLGLSAVDFFHSTVQGIIADARDTADNSYAIPLVPQQVETHTAIPKDYFMQFTGLVVLCTAADVGRCGQMVSQGFFDGAIGLKSQAVRGGIHDLDSALDFCQRMLRPNGVCDQTLPHTFRLYRSRIAEKCGGPSFTSGGKYINPHDPRDAMNIMNVDYGQYAQYENARSAEFQTFIFLIILIWYVTLVLELKRMIELLDMLCNFNIAQDHTYSFFPKSLRTKLRSITTLSAHDLLTTPRIPKTISTGDLNSNPTESLIITDISRPHWIVCLLMVGVRAFLWFYMANVGTTFLLASFSYEDILFDAISLAFIFELPEFLYHFLIAEEIQEQLSKARTAEYPTYLPTSGWKSVTVSRAFWGLCLIPVFVYIVCRYNYKHNIAESLEALQCACFQRGKNCVASRRFASSWWDQYWLDTFSLAKLRSSYLS